MCAGHHLLGKHNFVDSSHQNAKPPVAGAIKVHQSASMSTVPVLMDVRIDWTILRGPTTVAGKGGKLHMSLMRGKKMTGNERVVEWGAGLVRAGLGNRHMILLCDRLNAIG